MNSTGLIDLAHLRFSEICEDRKPFDRASWSNGYIQGWMERYSSHDPAMEQAAQDALNKAHVWHHPESSSYYLGAEGDNPDHLSVDLGTPQEALEQARREERLRVWRAGLSRIDSGKPHQLYTRAEIESIMAQAVSAASLLSAPEAADHE